MNFSIIASLFYLIAFGGLASSFFLLKKSDAKLYMVTWIPITAISVMAYQTLTAGVIGLVHIKVNIITLGIFDLLLAGVLWFLIYKKKERQSYTISRIDICFMVALVVVFLMFLLVRYGRGLQINYNSIDGAAHMASAMVFAKNGSIYSMYHASLQNGLFIQFLAPFFASAAHYKIYLIAEVLHLALSCFMFYGAIRSFCSDRFLRAAGVVVSFAYVFGYPANSSLFGFAYFGMCLTLIVCVVAVADEYMERYISKNMVLFMMMLYAYAVFESYVLFAPVVFLAILAFLLVEQKKEGKLISVDTIFVGLRVFLVPTALGLWYVYLGIFGNDSTLTVSDQINKEGGIYHNLFTNFLLVLPFAIYGLWLLVKNRKNHILTYLAVLEILFAAGMFALGLKQRVSGYYYYKNPFLLWTLCFLVAFFCITKLETTTRRLLVIGAVVWVMAAFSFVYNLRQKIWDMNPYMTDEITNLPTMDIYICNAGYTLSPRYSQEKLDLYGYAKTEVLEKEMSDVYCVAEWEDTYWMDAVCGSYTDKYSADSLASMVQSKELEYVVVLTDSNGYVGYADVYNSLERVYENSAGFVARVK